MNAPHLPATRKAIARLIPHQGAMCLLDRVESCTAEAIACASATHRDATNPLRRGDGLAAICAVEYALQAMALHGALTGGAAQGPGFLAAVSGVEAAVDRVEDIAGDLMVGATVLSRETRGFIYRFAIEGDGRALVSGRATIVLA